MLQLSELTINAQMANAIAGTIIPPGDKSVTHRALFFGALNHGHTVIIDPSQSADCRSTFNLLSLLGYDIQKYPDRWEMRGSNNRKHSEDLTLDCGNSGTTARLAAGFLTGERGRFTLIGDMSLSRRPMDRVVKPLSSLEADIRSTNGYLPVIIKSDGQLKGGNSTVIDVGSAQVHAALVLAGLCSREGVMLRRTKPMRDHTLRMLQCFGIDCGNADQRIERIPSTHIEHDTRIEIPGDISAAAFMIAAALLIPGSDLFIEHVGLNPTRIAFLRCLKAMGAKIEWSIEQDQFEPVGSIRIEYSPELSGIDLDKEGAISVSEMMDELPLLMLIASQASGTTSVRGAAELRLKESDRISSTINMLATLGVEIVELEDGFTVTGPQQIKGGVTVDHHGDHRLCMTAAVAALIADDPVVIPQPEVASVSYPNFWNDLASLSGIILQR